MKPGHVDVVLGHVHIVVFRDSGMTGRLCDSTSTRHGRWVSTSHRLSATAPPVARPILFAASTVVDRCHCALRTHYTQGRGARLGRRRPGAVGAWSGRGARSGRRIRPCPSSRVKWRRLVDVISIVIQPRCFNMCKGGPLRVGLPRRQPRQARWLAPGWPGDEPEQPRRSSSSLASWLLRHPRTMSTAAVGCAAVKIRRRTAVRRGRGLGGIRADPS